MRSHSRPMFSTALAFICWTAPAAADPITAVYRVQVTERMTWESNPIWEPFQQQFTLFMTFDPANASDRSYGPVWFSAVPLPSIPPPPGLSLTASRYTAHGQFEENPYGSSNLFATATVYENGSNAEWRYFRTTRLLTNVPVGDSLPVFSAATFPGHLVLGPDSFFDYGTSLFGPSGSGRPETLDFRGFATLLDVYPSEPIPEPATLVLVATGLAMFRRRAIPCRVPGHTAEWGCHLIVRRRRVWAWRAGNKGSH